MNLLIGGDFFISDKYRNSNLIDENILNLMSESNFRILNLESPLTENISRNRILKTGPYLSSRPDTIIPILKKLRVNLVTLANNHILDYGESSLINTLNVLKNNNIAYVGAGANSLQAAQPYILKNNDLSAAILNFAENEWSIAEKNKAGANPLNIIDNFNSIKAAKNNHDKVVCIIHGGNEYCKFPSPQIIKQFKFYIDSGADAIISHHTHCIGGYEIYKKAPILYGIGNFVFTLNSRNNEWYRGLLALFSIEKNKSITFKIFPVKQHHRSFYTTKISGDELKSVNNELYEINEIIKDNKKLVNAWNNCIQSNRNEYLNLMSPFNFISNRYLRVAINKMGLGKMFINKISSKYLLNALRCESHSEGFKLILKNILEKY